VRFLYEGLELVDEEEFLKRGVCPADVQGVVQERQGTDGLAHADMMKLFREHDPHRFMIARLQFELDERKRYIMNWLFVILFVL
jgi:hypothetical protein